MAIYIPAITTEYQIEYLVRNKFPQSRDLESAIARMERSGSEADEEAAKYKLEFGEVEEYKNQLELLPLEEIEKLYSNLVRLEKEAREKSYPFNKPSTDADFDYWSKMHGWSLDEAIALSFGKNPKQINWKLIERYEYFISDFGRKYEKLRDLALTAKKWGKLYDPILPPLFVKWAEDNEIDFPKKLAELVIKRRGNVMDWQAEAKKWELLYNESQEARKDGVGTQGLIETCNKWQELCNQANAQRDQYKELYLKKVEELKELTRVASATSKLPEKEDKINKKALNTLLKLVGGMTVAIYNYNPNDRRSDVITQIQTDLDLKGISMDTDTIRKWVKESMKHIKTLETVDA